MVSGGDNGFDGDYYRSRWSETGVVEADCLLCHMPGYDMQKRNLQLSELNFKWAAAAGSGMARVTGSVKKGERPSVEYDRTAFDAQGRVAVPLAREVPAENCLFCHRETDWKKKGTSYMSRFDVHLRAGMQCIECHPGGTSARDERISGFEEHNFAKGDGPGALVRDDLDNTMVTCAGCHRAGLHNAPAMKHAAFKPAGVLETHLEPVACQTCHIPRKAVKAALVQDSTVFNPQPRIPRLKRIWSFYGPDMKPWNYYGEVRLRKSPVRPLFFYRPQLRRYKGRLFPAASLYSVWFGLRTEGREGLDQVFMQDILGMWTDRQAYPLLVGIRDDNGDGVCEINRPAEIDAALSSLRAYLEQAGRLGKAEPVFVDGARVYCLNGDVSELQARAYEYSPYGSTFKLNHDVAPAGAALGAGGCGDCHGGGSDFFSRSWMIRPFDRTGAAVTAPAWKVIGYTEAEARDLMQGKAVN